MPTDKSLPDTDDIIDLTDLVEEGTADGASSASESPADLSFEQELDDLFGDVDTGEPKSDAPAQADDDVIDLEGLDLPTDQPDAKGQPAPTAAPADAAATDDIMDLSELDFSDLDGTTEAAKPTDDVDVADLDFASPTEAAQAGEADETPINLEELDLPELEEAKPGLADAGAVDALLGDLPDETPVALAGPDAALDVSGLPDLAELPELEELPGLEEEPALAVAQPAAVPVRPVSPPIQPAGMGIDLDALDRLIVAAKGPEPESEAADLPAALAERLDALEGALAGLAERLEALPEPADHDALARTLTERLEARLLELRQEAVPAETAASDREALVAELRQALAPDFDALRQSLPAPDAWVTPKGLSEALTALRESLSVDLAAVLRTAKQAARDEAAAMGEALAARLDALEADRTDPEALAERVRQALLPALPDGAAALETARQALDGLADRVSSEDFRAALDALRAETSREIERAVPKAAAAVIREEIAALARELGDEG